jgi:ribonucleoside-diphosphate reductase alpha chain
MLPTSIESDTNLKTKGTQMDFKSPYNEFVYLRTYARWIKSKGRREKWPETVDRYMNFMKENLGEKLDGSTFQVVRDAILKHEVMPSMRLMQFAGEPARKTNVCAYNCSFIAPTQLRDLSDILYILMCGTGVGFSVETESVEKFPKVELQNPDSVRTYIIADSKEGWADAFLFGLEQWFSGNDVIFNYSNIRAAGSRLKTFGGFSSGPQPLIDLLVFSRQKILSKQGLKLTPIDIHDIVCKTAEIVVCGGVRRSALISLSDLNDSQMRDAKQGQFWINEPQRSLSNNSAIYDKKPSASEFLEEFLSLIKSGSGERGIFNRGDIKKHIPSRRLTYLTDGYIGTNPCGEIILNCKNGGGQFCNLSEVICRPEDTKETLLNKIRVATIVGTYQSTLTNFSYLSKAWEENCKEERLLGVSLTGQMDCECIRDAEVLKALKKEAIITNIEYAKKFGVNESTSITCVKPSGNVSQMVGCSSGLHGAFAEYYIRRVRITHNDPLFRLAFEQGVPVFPEVGQTIKNTTTWVLEFPQRAPEGSILQSTMNAIDQLEYWKKVKLNFTEHNPSVTIFVKADEWIAVAEWVYRNWNIIGGLSFLPTSDHVYQLAPYEKISKQEYERRMNALSNLDLSLLSAYESHDHTRPQVELACAGNNCEL